jgi:hypothetical protein
VDRALITYREPVMNMRLVQERIARAAIEMFASECVIGWLDSELQDVGRNGDAVAGSDWATDLFPRHSFLRTRLFLSELTDNDDKAPLATASSVLTKSRRRQQTAGSFVVRGGT